MALGVLMGDDYRGRVDDVGIDLKREGRATDVSQNEYGCLVEKKHGKAFSEE